MYFFFIKNFLKKVCIIFGSYSNIIIGVFIIFVKVNLLIFNGFIKFVKISYYQQYVKNFKYMVVQSFKIFYKRNLMLYVIVKYYDKIVINDDNKSFEFIFIKIVIILEFLFVICLFKKFEFVIF